MDSASLLNTLKSFTTQYFVPPGLRRNDGLYSNNKLYRNQAISYNILRKATQLVNDLEGAKTATDSLTAAILHIRNLRAKHANTDNGNILQTLNRGSTLNTKS